MCGTAGKRRYNIKLWKTFTDCFNCLPVSAIVDEKILCMHGGLSPELLNMEQIKRIMRPTGQGDSCADHDMGGWMCEEIYYMYCMYVCV